MDFVAILKDAFVFRVADILFSFFFPLVAQLQKKMGVSVVEV